jgi:formate dehydrogenase accessory protein FdhE
MTTSPWQRRIERAQELVERHAFAAETLRFYIELARFQEGLHHQLSCEIPPQESRSSASFELAPEAVAKLASRFASFLSMVEKHGPAPLAEVIRELRADEFWAELLQDAWRAQAPSDARGFLAQAFLQPYAEILRSRASLAPAAGKYASCPFCHRKPCFGILRPMGEGAARSLVCSFCMAEWDFRRLVCPGCGEEDDKQLPVFTASDFDYIRVECCETCKTYIKTIDLTKNGLAEPMVDELASAPLDLWAREHGYAKLQPNLLGM